MNQNNLKLKNQHRKGSFLWEVKGGKAKMYLKGTVHMVPKSFFPLKDEILNSFDECSNLVLEVILNESEFTGIKITNDILFNKEYIYEDGDSLYNHFSKEKVINLKNYLVNNDLCSKDIAKKFYKLKPEIVEALLYNGRFKQAGIDQEYVGIDYYLLKRAREMGKNILELETKEFQEKILAKLYKESDQKNSEEAKNNSPDYTHKKLELGKLPILDSGYFSKLMNQKIRPRIFGIKAKAYGSIYGNEKIIKRMRKIAFSSDSPLLGNRDEEMCKKIEGFLKIKDSYFVAVGAMHLIGEGSIIDRLEKKGYEISKIC